MQKVLEDALDVLKRRLFALRPGNGVVSDEEEKAIIHDMGTIQNMLAKLRK
jgi:hypothetical protein